MESQFIIITILLTVTAAVFFYVGFSKAAEHNAFVYSLIIKNLRDSALPNMPFHEFERHLANATEKAKDQILKIED